MRCRFHLWIFTALLLARGFAAEIPPRVPNELGRLIVKNYSSRVYSGHHQVWSTVQDATGVVYFGVDPQVITFDGATWRKVPVPGATDSIRGLAVAADGKVYVGGTNIFGRLRPLGNGRHVFESLLEQLPEKERDFGTVGQILARGDTVYVAASRKLLVWRDGRTTVFPAGLNGRLHPVGDALFFHVDSKPLHRIERDGAGARLVKVSDDPVFLKNTVRLIAPAPDGTTVVVTRANRLFTLRGADLTPRPTEVDPFLQGKRIGRAWALAGGRLALATEEEGVLIIAADGRWLHALDETNGLQNARVHALTPDRAGGFWLGLNSGIAHVGAAEAFTFFDRQSGLPASGINDIERHDGALYVATTQDLYRLAAATGAPQGARFERVLAGEFFTLHADAGGFFALGNRALYQLTRDGFVSVLPLANSSVYVVHRSRRTPELLWLGTGKGLKAVRQTPAGWRDEGWVRGIDDTVRTLAEMPDGKIWGSTYGNGVFRVTPAAAEGKSPSADATLETFPGGDTAPRMVRVADWGGDLIFTASKERTLFQFDEATRTFAPFRGIGLLPDGANLGSNLFGAGQPEWLWLIRTYTNQEDKRIYRATRGGGVQALPQSVYDAITTPLRFFEERGPAGPVLWIGGTDGLMRVEVDRAFPPAVPYAASLWTREPRIRDGDELPYGGRESYDFEFVAPRHAPVHPVKYQSRLVGENAKWSALSADHKRTYTHLAEGTYRFEVRAKDVDGHVSAPATLAFTILPPWWRTWWAYGGYGLGFAGVVFGFARLRTRALRKKNEQLEKIVASRTDDLRRQNGELARLHKLELDEKISARLVAEKAQLDVLRYQLNPHFLFNSLTSIRSQIPPALGSARDTLDRLADFCRLTLHGRKAEERTTVGEEIAMLRAYLDIEQTRMGELLSVEFAVDASLDAVLMPRLLLLPLVENALKYGQATSEDTLALKISAQRAAESGEGVVFEISNTGTWVERGSRPGIPSTGIGHENLRERLLRHYPDAFVFSHSAADGWVHVRLELKAVAKSP